ncbi:MAG TPA: LCP family protein [Anaerolineales bacterium]|jgi:LCP family protein required for cell wall assembly
MKLGNVLGILFAGTMALGAVAFGALALRAAYERSLGPTLEPIESTATSTDTPPIASATAAATAASGTAAFTPTNSSSVSIVRTSTPRPALAGPVAAVCGETTAWNLLVLGADTVALRGDKGSDLTRLVQLDFPRKRVTVYAFSRDLWVSTSGLGLTGPTVDATELGTVFYEAFKRSTHVASRDKLIDGTNLTARMLALNFGVRVDHYVTVDMVQIPAMIDAVGGVPIYIPARVTDPWIGMVIEPGQQTLTGAQAAAYARAIPDSDFVRIQRQQLLLEAMRAKLRDPAVWIRIPSLYAQYNQVIATDLSPEQINHLACLLNEVPADSIIQESVDQIWTSPGPVAGSFVWDKNMVTNELRALGLIP